MEKFKQRRDELRTLLSTEPLRPWRTIGKAALLAFVAFNAISGFIMVTVPLVRLAAMNIEYKVWRHFINWLWEEPHFGREFNLTWSLVGLLVALWLARDVLRLWALELLVMFTHKRPLTKVEHTPVGPIVTDSRPERPPMDGEKINREPQPSLSQIRRTIDTIPKYQNQNTDIVAG